MIPLSPSREILEGDDKKVPVIFCEVAWGSVLLPILFKVYLRAWGKTVQLFGVRRHQYADDDDHNQLSCSLSSNPGPAVSILTKFLSATGDWV